MTDNTHPTLGQRIDAVLEPLYAEAEQHRATIIKAREAQQALQEQIDTANQGLALIESRMAQVVRSLAEQEPIIAAMFGGQSQLDAVEPTTDNATEPTLEPTADETPSPVAAIESAAQADADEESAPQVSASPTDAPTTDVATPSPSDADPEPAPAIELDPAADAEAVSEVAAMLDAPPKVAPSQVEAEASTQAESEAETEAETEPEIQVQADADPVAEEACVEESDPAPANITAAAERAAIAAKQLRDKAASTR